MKVYIDLLLAIDMFIIHQYHGFTFEYYDLLLFGKTYSLYIGNIKKR